MKKSLLAGASLGVIALATGSHAADIGARPFHKAPPITPAPWSWTGFYVGANVGAVWGRNSVSDDPSSTDFWIAGGGSDPGTVDANSTGVIGGLQAGYNWQYASVVFGIEGDISLSSLDHTVTITTSIGGGPDSYRSELSALGTIRGRIGWAFDRLLLYGTGGGAFARLKSEYVDPPSVTGFIVSPRSNVTGWTAGGGFEYAFTDHWTAKAEYLHVWFPDRSGTFIIGPGASYTFNFKDSLDIVRVGINYKF